MTKPQLTTSYIDGQDIWILNVQVVCWEDEFYQYQHRYEDVEAKFFMGHFMVDANDNWVEMRGAGLDDFKTACEILSRNKGTTKLGNLSDY